MGKRRKRLTMAKYASKYAKKRAAILGNKVKLVEKETIQVTEPEPVSSPEPVTVVEEQPEPEQKPPRPNALKEIVPEEPEVTQETEPEPEVEKEVVKKTRTRRTRKKKQPKETTEE